MAIRFEGKPMFLASALPGDDRVRLLGHAGTFRESWASLPLGQVRAYRETKELKSRHIRVYDDHYTIHTDSYNPEYSGPGFVGHALFDVPYITGPFFLLGRWLVRWLVR